MSSGDGIAQKCGTIDFFPNGGGEQPGCGRHILGEYNEPKHCKREKSEKECHKKEQGEQMECEKERDEHKYCENEMGEEGKEELEARDFKTSHSRQACSQMRAVEYFVASLKCSDCFLGHECSDPYLYADVRSFDQFGWS